MKPHLAWGAAILVATAGASLVAALPAQVSYCTVCGAREEVHAYGLRFGQQPLLTRHAVRATSCSQLLEEKHLVAAHRHQWQAPRFVPDPLNQFGPEVYESLEVLNTPRVLNFLRDVADYADPISVAKWKDLALQPAYARVLDDSLRFMHVPVEGFADRTGFLVWWGQNSFAVYNRLREVTEPD